MLHKLMLATHINAVFLPDRCSVAGMFVGFLAGLAGVGGGSLMAPILIPFFGFNPAVAMSTDLWIAAITRAVGGTIHHRIGSADRKIVKRLSIADCPLLSSH